MKNFFFLVICLVSTVAFSQSPCSAILTSSSASQTVCLDSSLTIITFDDDQYNDKSLGLPPGVSYSRYQITCITTPCYSKLSIYGTPTASGVYNYMLASSVNNCTPNTTGTITVSTTGACARSCFANYSTTYDTLTNMFTLTLDAANNGTSYLWNFGDGTMSTLATPTHTFTKDSTYNVCLSVTTAANDTCTYCHTIGKDTAGNIYRTPGFSLNVVDPRTPVPTSILTTKPKVMAIYPNPNDGVSTLSFSAEVSNIVVNVYNSSGIRVAGSSNFSGTQFTINLTNEPNGVYIVETIQNGKTNTTKLIKQ